MQGQTEPTQSVLNTASSDAPAPATSDEIQKVKDELTTARKEAEDLRTRLDIVNTASNATDNEAKAIEPKDDEQIAIVKAAQDQRETELNKLEAEVNVRLENVKDREAKSKNLLERANSKILKIREDTNKEIDRLKSVHQAEIESLQQEKQAANTSTIAPAPQEAGQSAMVSVPDDMINTQTLPRPSITGMQLKAWINNDSVAKQVISSQIKKHIETKEKELNTVITTLNQEIESLKTQQPVGAGAPVKLEPGQASSQSLQEELAKAKAEYENNLRATLDKEKQAWIQRGKDEEGKRFNVKMSMANRKTDMANDKFEAVNVKWLYVQRVAKDTPTQEVGLVFEQADQQKPPPKPAAQPNTPAKPQGLGPVQATAPTQLPQSNGSGTNFATQTALPNQPPNPFLQAAQSIAPNPFLQVQNQMGRGLQQPGFTGPAQIPQTQQPQQQFGRGRGDGVGTGPQALRGVLQSSIPRGGASNIPLTGGRGRGQQQQQPQPNPNQSQGPNATPQGAGASQIGRGGGRGAGRGRGIALNVQGQTNVVPGQGSPRGSLNPGATQFQPSGGRGQKRGPDDDAEGGTRGGKRPRGRGGQGGGGGAGAGGASAASAE